MRDPEGHGDSLGPHLLPRHPQEVGLCALVVEDGQDGGPDSVVVQGPVGLVVAQIGSEAVRHGGGGRTAPRSHSRKQTQSFPSLRRTAKASGFTARMRPSCRKWRDALMGGSTRTISQPSRGA